MKIDLNINNNQKHWIIIAFDKCRDLVWFVFMSLVGCLRNIWFFIKRTWRYFLCIAVVLITIICITCCYIYYKDIYIPEKKLKTALSEIIANLNSDNDSIKTIYSYYCLECNHRWGYEEVNDNYITSQLEEYRENAFKQIESKAYEGNPKWQYVLGQLYRWGKIPNHELNLGNYNKYCDKAVDSYVSYLNRSNINLYTSYDFYVERDMYKATYWWNESAKQGYAPAYNNLGIAFKYGNGVEINIEKAVYYLRKGAESGDRYAQRNFGDMFVDEIIYISELSKNDHSQEGLSDNHKPKNKDIERAIYWWTKAAAQGDELAKERLQKVYE